MHQLAMPLEKHDPLLKQQLVAQVHQHYYKSLDATLLAKLPNDRLQYIIDWKKAFDDGGAIALEQKGLLPSQCRQRQTYTREVGELEREIFNFSFAELFRDSI